MSRREIRSALLASMLAGLFAPAVQAQAGGATSAPAGPQASAQRQAINDRLHFTAGFFCDADDCSDPDDITVFLGSFGPVAYSTFSATTSGPTHPACPGDQQIYRDVWCFWMSDYTGQIVIRTCATPLWFGLAIDETRVGVYQGVGCGGQLLECHGSGCGDHVYFTMDVVAGQAYTLRLGSSSSNDKGLGWLGIYRDCNRNGIPDWEDLLFHTSSDCNHNKVPDECELTGNDCNYNGIPDECDEDHNYNDIPDDCELEEIDCEEFDRTELLTPEDTITFFTEDHNPQQEKGYFWAYAVDQSVQGIDFDFLTGQLLVVNGLETMRYAINAVDYRSPAGHGLHTDDDNDGIRDLDGVEYDKTAGEILFPRYFGQDGSLASRMILIALSGGANFVTQLDFLVYNDDEDQFSTGYTFRCWDNVALIDISALFDNNWLKFFSGQNTEEDFDGTEYGWIHMNGDVANSTFKTIYDPAVYGVLVSVRIGNAAADLPFETCLQPGHLLPRGNGGDNSETGDPEQVCDEEVLRRRPASLLLFPEFDNRSGMKSVATVTNTHDSESVRVHFVYIGRYE